MGPLPTDASVHLLPVLFISHGAPDLLISGNPAREFLAQLGDALPRPSRILVVSAHWIAQPAGITAGALPGLIYDFQGFPAELYRIEYPAAGDAQLGRAVESALTEAGFAARIDAARGLDHGAWVPLKLLYPDADVPVVQVSLPVGDMASMVRFGAALAGVRDGNTLLLCSGSTVHNLREANREGRTGAWAARFEAWLAAVVTGGRLDELIDPARRPAEFARAHPTVEHLAPLVVAWAAAGRDAVGERIYAGFDYGNIGMSCYRFA